MELIVLGRSGGFPMPGEATSGYLLRHGETAVLVDCGSGVLSNLFRFVPVTGLSALILSHLHSDHQADVAVLKYALNMTRRSGRPSRTCRSFFPPAGGYGADRRRSARPAVL
jgi:ribonuclease BN (tRNA processing enzyme)